MVSQFAKIEFANCTAHNPLMGRRALNRIDNNYLWKFSRHPALGPNLER